MDRDAGRAGLGLALRVEPPIGAAVGCARGVCGMSTRMVEWSWSFVAPPQQCVDDVECATYCYVGICVFHTHYETRPHG